MSLFKAQRDYQSKFPGWRHGWNDPATFLHWIEEVSAYYASLPFSAIELHPYFGQGNAK